MADAKSSLPKEKEEPKGEAEIKEVKQEVRDSGDGDGGDKKGEEEANPGTPTKLTGVQKLKQAVRDYGSTVIVFHVGISLISLGGFYLAVSSGLDTSWLMAKIGLDGGSAAGSVAAGASTFVVAYAVHKVFAPLRISITLASTPFIVKYLRRVGFLKPPK